MKSLPKKNLAEDINPMDISAPPPLARLRISKFAQKLKSGPALLTAGKRALGNLAGTSILHGKLKSNRAAAADHGWFQGIAGAGTGWARTE